MYVLSEINLKIKLKIERKKRTRKYLEPILINHKGSYSFNFYYLDTCFINYKIYICQ